MPLSVYRGNTPVLWETDYIRDHFQFPLPLGPPHSTVDPVCAASSCVQKLVWLSMHGTCKLCTQLSMHRTCKLCRQLSMHGACELCRQLSMHGTCKLCRQLSMQGTFKLHTDSCQCMGLLSCTQTTFQLHTQLSNHETLKLRTKSCQCMRLHRGAV